MRKILLASTALVAFAGAAQAAESPISVNVGGYVDFRAAMFQESLKAEGNGAGAVTKRLHGDFETEYRLNIEAQGKAANGVEYGGLVSLWNGNAYTGGSANAGGVNNVIEDQANVWLSGGWGKLILGDDHGASDLAVFAPTVGEGQVDGTYTSFTNANNLVQFQPGYINETENNTKATYYTPKVGNENNHVQLGVSFTPNFNDQGRSVITNATGNTGVAARDVVESAIQYTGKLSDVDVVAAANLVNGQGHEATTVNTHSTQTKDFTAYGVGAQVAYKNFTFGGSYENAGSFGADKAFSTGGRTWTQSKAQDVYSLGAKYEQDKVAVALNALSGRGYSNGLVAGTVGAANVDQANYVRNFEALGFGATYTWFPGLTSAFDTVFFEQKRGDESQATVGSDKGEVVMVSQKITF